MISNVLNLLYAFLLPLLINLSFFIYGIVILNKLNFFRKNYLLVGYLIGFYLFIQIHYLINLFLPVNFKIVLTWLVISAMLLFYKIKINIITSLNKIYKKFSKKFWILSFLSYTLLIYLSKSKILFEDSKFTHLKIEKIFMTNKVPIGLGNDNPYFAYGTPIQKISGSTLINYGAETFRFTSLIFFLILFFILVIIISENNINQFNLEFYFILISVFLAYCMLVLRPQYWLSSPNYDFPAMIIFIVINFLAIRFVKTKDNSILYTLSMLGGLLTQIRLTAIIYVFLTLFTLVIFFYNITKIKLLVNNLILVILTGFLAWLDRLLLSGYPLYPLTIFDLNFDWKIPKDVVTTKMIYGARYVANKEIESGAFQRDRILILLLLTIIVYFVYMFVRRKFLIKRNLFKNNLIIINLILYIIFWIVTAPVIRYIWGPFISLIALFWAKILTNENMKEI